MKILHLYNDWKWTGPSEPVLNLCVGLQRAGFDVHLACLSCPVNRSTGLPDRAIKANIKILLLSPPSKYLSSLYILQHIRALRRYVSKEGFDIIHCHSALDHFYAYLLRMYYPALAPSSYAQRRGTRKGWVRIIRTNHKGYPLEISLANRFLMRSATDGYITLSKNLAEADWKNFDLPDERVEAISNGINPALYDKQPRLSKKGLVKDDDIVVGVVARVQRHRRFNIILEAMKAVAKQMPNIKLVVVGRGTHYKELITEPVKQMGLQDNVIFAGYRTGDYLDIISIFDFGIFLVPGSDGSCRAALEMMASGKPLIVSQRGVLPEIVDDNKNGLVIDDTPDNLAQAILKLAGDKELRERFSVSARQKIERHFTLEQVVKQTADFYQKIIKTWQ